MEHVKSDPHGYWDRAGEAELAARLAVKAERERWRAILAQYLPPDIIRRVTQQVLDAAEHTEEAHRIVKEVS